MFDPLIRLDTSDIARQAHSIRQGGAIFKLLKDLPSVFIILNEFRQVVYINADPLVTFNIKSPKEIVGYRPGECFGCEYSSTIKGGCGASAFCQVCGFNKVLLESEKNREATKGECLIMLKSGKSIALRVSSRPFIHRHEKFTFCMLENISHEKYRQTLEELFLNDLKNSISSLGSMSHLCRYISGEECGELLNGQVKRLKQETESFQIMLTAEKGDLESRFTQVSLEPLLDETVLEFQLDKDFRNKTIIQDTVACRTRTDSTLLRRVVSNLLRNALEADNKDAPIILRCRKENDGVRIMVENNYCMPQDVQMQVFRKFYSTKAPTRGFGTYAAKLLTEEYLHGKVDFVSGEGMGTVFSIWLPSEQKKESADQMHKKN